MSDALLALLLVFGANGEPTEAAIREANARGNAALETGAYDAALEEYQRARAAIEALGDRQAALGKVTFLIGYCHEKLERWTEASDAYKSAIELAPKDVGQRAERGLERVRARTAPPPLEAPLAEAVVVDDPPAMPVASTPKDPKSAPAITDVVPRAPDFASSVDVDPAPPRPSRALPWVLTGGALVLAVSAGVAHGVGRSRLADANVAYEAHAAAGDAEARARYQRETLDADADALKLERVSFSLGAAAIVAGAAAAWVWLAGDDGAHGASPDPGLGGMAWRF